jgi:acyl-CoA thioesterase
MCWLVSPLFHPLPLLPSALVNSYREHQSPIAFSALPWRRALVTESEEIARAMSSLKDYFQRDRFAAAAGIELITVSPGAAHARMAVVDQHLNSVGVVHGGALFTLADFAFAAACNAAGSLAVGINMTIACVKAITTGVLEAEAVEVSRSRRLSTCAVRITDQAGELVAQFQGTAYIRNAPFPPQPEG